MTEMLVRPEAIDYPPPETLPAVMDSIINEQVIAFHRTVVQAKDEATGVLSLAADEAAMLLPEHMRRNQYLRLAAACRQTDTIGSAESQAIAAISKTVELARSTVLIGRAVEAMHLNKYRPEIHGAAIEKASRHWDDEHRRRLSQKEAMTWDTMAEVASRSVSTAVGCKQIIEILQPRQPLLRRQLLRAVDVLDKLDRGQTIDPKADLSPICELTEEIFSDNRYRQRQAVQSADEVLRDKIGTVIAERVKRYKQQGDERRSAAYNGLIIAMGGKVIEPSSTPTTAKNTPQVELQLTAQAKHRHSRRSSRPPKPAVQPTATTEESAPKVIWNPRGVAAATALLATAAGIAAPASAASAPAASETAATVHYANPEATALPTAQKDLRTIVIKQPVAPGAIEQQPTMPAKVAQPPETIQMPSSHDVPKSQNASVPETTVVQPTPGETSTTTVPTTDTPTTPAQGPEQTDAPTNGNGDPQTVTVTAPPTNEVTITSPVPVPTTGVPETVTLTPPDQTPTTGNNGGNQYHQTRHSPAPPKPVEVVIDDTNSDAAAAAAAPTLPTAATEQVVTQSTLDFVKQYGTTQQVVAVMEKLLQQEGKYSPVPETPFIQRYQELMQTLNTGQASSSLAAGLVWAQSPSSFDQSIADEYTITNPQFDQYAIDTLMNDPRYFGGYDDEGYYSSQVKEGIYRVFVAALLANTTPEQQTQLLASIPPEEVPITQPSPPPDNSGNNGNGQPSDHPGGQPHTPPNNPGHSSHPPADHHNGHSHDPHTPGNDPHVPDTHWHGPHLGKQMHAPEQLSQADMEMTAAQHLRMRGGLWHVRSLLYTWALRDGWSPVAAAGIIGNVDVESTDNPARVQNNPDSNYISSDIIGVDGYGWFQLTWGPLQQGLMNYAENHGSYPGDPEMQWNYVMKLIDTQYPGLKDQMNSAKSPREAARIFMNNFEHPEADVNHLDWRQQHAYEALQAFHDELQQVRENYHIRLQTYHEWERRQRQMEREWTRVQKLRERVRLQAHLGRKIAQHAHSYVHNGPFQELGVLPVHEYTSPAYRHAVDRYGGGAGDSTSYTDCGKFVATVLRASGADPHYPTLTTGVQLNHILSAHYADGSPRYEIVKNTGSTSKVQAGDIFVTPNHTYIAVQTADGLRAAEASQYNHGPHIDSPLFFSDSEGVSFTIARIIPDAGLQQKLTDELNQYQHLR